MNLNGTLLQLSIWKREEACIEQRFVKVFRCKRDVKEDEYATETEGILDRQPGRAEGEDPLR